MTSAEADVLEPGDEEWYRELYANSTPSPNGESIDNSAYPGILVQSFFSYADLRLPRSARCPKEGPAFLIIPI